MKVDEQSVDYEQALSFLEQELKGSIPLTNDLRNAVLRLVEFVPPDYLEWPDSGVTKLSDDGVSDVLIRSRFSTTFRADDGHEYKQDGQLIPTAGIYFNGEQRLKIYDMKRVVALRDVCDAIIRAEQESSHA